jgi:hypothetical protein
MDRHDPKRQDQFWAAYRRSAEENRVSPDRSPYYVKWVKEYIDFFPEKRLKQRCGNDIKAFLDDLAGREGIADWHGGISPPRGTCMEVADRCVPGRHENPLRRFDWFGLSGSESIPSCLKCFPFL